MAKKTPPVEYIPDGPIMSLLRKPQLMYVKSERSTFMTKRKMNDEIMSCLLYTSPSPRDATLSRMPSSA